MQGRRLPAIILRSPCGLLSLSRHPFSLPSPAQRDVFIPHLLPRQYVQPFLEMVFGGSKRARRSDIPVPVLEALNRDKTSRGEQVWTGVGRRGWKEEEGMGVRRSDIPVPVLDGGSQPGQDTREGLAWGGGAREGGRGDAQVGVRGGRESKGNSSKSIIGRETGLCWVCRTYLFPLSLPHSRSPSPAGGAAGAGAHP